MINIKIVNKPEMLKGKPLIHKTECYAFEFNSRDNKVAIYENFNEWYDQTPAFYFTEVVEITASMTEEDENYD